VRRTVRSLQIELLEFGIDDRCLEDNEIAPGAVIHCITLPLDRLQLVRDGRNSGYELHFTVYGRNAILGDREPLKATPAHELGIVVQGVAPTKRMAEEVCMIATRQMFYARLPQVKGTAGLLDAIGPRRRRIERSRRRLVRTAHAVGMDRCVDPTACPLRANLSTIPAAGAEPERSTSLTEGKIMAHARAADDFQAIRARLEDFAP